MNKPTLKRTDDKKIKRPCFVQFDRTHLRTGRKLLRCEHRPFFMAMGKGGDSEGITKRQEDRTENNRIAPRWQCRAFIKDNNSFVAVTDGT